MAEVVASRVVRGGGEQTRKTIVAIFALCISMVMSITPVPASAAPSVMICYFDVTLLTPENYWIGTVEGFLDGTIKIETAEVAFVGHATIIGSVEQFSETSTITTEDGLVVEGFDVGVSNLFLGTAVSNGEVTGVSVTDESEVSVEDWEWLVGWHIHIMGEVVPNPYVYEFAGVLMLMPSGE